MKANLIFLLMLFLLTPQVSAQPQVTVTIDDIDLNAGDTRLFSLNERNAKILH